MRTSRDGLLSLAVAALVLLGAAVFFGTGPGDAADEGPLTSEEAVVHLELPDGFQATLFAGEPDVVQPIAFTIDHRGRLELQRWKGLSSRLMAHADMLDACLPRAVPSAMLNKRRDPLTDEELQQIVMKHGGSRRKAARALASGEVTADAWRGRLNRIFKRHGWT